MLKHFLAFAILTHCVFCRIAPEERQWAEGDARQNCTETCWDECISCNEPSRCSEDEIKCGEESPENHLDCPPSEVCYPGNCFCPTDPDCPLICTQDCNDNNEIKCPGGIVDGCPQNDYCHPKDPGCPGWCPFECDDHEITCPVPNDPVTGCPVPAMCIPKQTTHQGVACAFQECPLLCHFTLERLCIGDIDHEGCKEADLCVTKQESNSGELCPGNCPVDCESGELLCKGQTDCDTGCVAADQCVDKATNVNGEYCADDSASHGCPITCCDDEILCPAQTDSVGCEANEECKLRTPSTCNGTQFCPDPTDCPTICSPNEVLCPVGGKDDCGCEIPDICIVQDRDIDGELCPVQCPFECNTNEILCTGHRNEKGCEEPATCVTREIKQWGNDKGSLCPGVCPERCEHDEILCPSEADPCDGCPTEQLCYPKHKNVNGEFCPDDSASHGCPKFCFENEVIYRQINDQVLCPVYEDVLGCKPEAQCFQRSKSLEGEYCPSTSVCPVNCQGDDVECSDGVDSRGCSRENLCIPKGADKDGTTCVINCPPVCPDSQIYCAGSTLPNGCQADGTCNDVDVGCPVLAITWNELRSDTLNTCDDTAVEEYGIFGKEDTLSTLDECKLWCENDPQCAFIFYQPSRPMCHLFTQCTVTRMAGAGPGIVMEMVRGGGGQSQEVCEKAYNGYYSYGDCGEQGGVASFDECCALTKQRQLDEPDRGINRFSYNGDKCYFKCGGNQDNRGGSFWSSVEDISTCACGQA